MQLYYSTYSLNHTHTHTQYHTFTTGPHIDSQEPK